ncbi:hypothetical protein TD95_001625 [Thielaviopsis punctulata]|uniref:CENP-C homolog n=1 Tax=Thielaviopsis punctulata TaxID=72032 RepID=A0A0F4Z992_9PEZI|nr:hypothetical protein TD95_001625 [Thielaviopsis punctulata]
MSHARSARRQTQQVFELGQAGRKTGVTLRDNGQRDEHGLQPLDGLFSSPLKPDGSTPRVERSMGEQDMDIDDASSPGPSTVIRNRRSGSTAFAIARSPMHTSLGSPAVKNPRLSARMSPQVTSKNTSSLFAHDSPTLPVPSVVPNKSTFNGKQITVTRNLFAAPKPTLAAQRKNAAAGSAANGKKSLLHPFMSDSDDNDDNILQPQADVDIVDESMQMIKESIQSSDAPQVPDDDEDDVRPVRRSNRTPRNATNKPDPAKPTSNKRLRNPEPDNEDDQSGSDSDISNTPVRLPSPKVPRTAKSRNASSTAAAAAATASSQAEKKLKPAQTPAHPPKSKPRTKPSPAQAQTRKARAPPLKQKTSTTAKPKPFARRNVQLKTLASTSDDDDDEGHENDDNDYDNNYADADKSLIAAHRGPPPPKRRGLMSVHTNPNAILTTRSGRSSFRPLQFWKGEHVQISTEAVPDVSGKGAFVMPKVKDIVRVADDEDAAPLRKRRRARPAKTTRQGASADSRAASPLTTPAAPGHAEPQERWERYPGVVEGDVVLWTHDHDEHPPGPDDEVGIVTEQLALSSSAVETREIKDATFRYAKTMSLGFMGSGIVDLPPGSEKRPKNSRRMQLVFFVAYGKVKVTIHDNEFRIGAGGQFFVPRGNYYSIANDYDGPARIFFAQACEVEMAQEGGAEDEGE